MLCMLISLSPSLSSPLSLSHPLSLPAPPPPPIYMGSDASSLCFTFNCEPGTKLDRPWNQNILFLFPLQLSHDFKHQAVPQSIVRSSVCGL